MRLIDAKKFDFVIYHVPDDVYDAQSYVRGVEDVLEKIRKTEAVIEMPDGFTQYLIDWLKKCPMP